MCWSHSSLAQVHQFSSDDITVSPDVVEFHFDDHQRLLHIASSRVRWVWHVGVSGCGWVSVSCLEVEVWGEGGE